MVNKILLFLLVLVVFGLIVQVNLFVRLLAAPIVLVFLWDIYNHRKDQKHHQTTEQTSMPKK